MIDPTNHRGIAYLVLGWSLTFIAMLLCTIRMYSRTILTRSVGSDDFAILVALALIIAGNVGDTMAVSNGFGQHEALVPPADIKQFQKWTNIDWIMAFICFCFVRMSVMLFVLRLLPVYKRWQKNVILCAFALNIAVTLIGTVSYGLSCIPFRAWYQEVPNARCFGTDKLVITNQVNGVLSCVVDIITAFIPMVLLWKVQMKASTKRSLNLIFSLGLITSSLSIARVATINNKVLTEDTTFRTLVSGTCSLVEGEMGIICACGPSIRQFVAYIQRTGTALPSRSRQRPNEDFVKMRRRINIRDIFWYQSPHLTAGRVLDALPVRSQKSAQDVESTAQKSLLGEWRRKFGRGLFGSTYGSSSDSRGTDTKGSSFGQTNYSGSSRGAANFSQNENTRIGRKYRGWGLLKDESTSTGASNDSQTQPPFLNDDSAAMSANRDYELADALADPVKAAEGDARHSFMPTGRETGRGVEEGVRRPPVARGKEQKGWDGTW